MRLVRSVSPQSGDEIDVALCFSGQIWPLKLCLATPFSRKIIVFYFLFLRPVEYVLIAMSQKMVFIGYDEETITGVGCDAPLLTHMSPEINSTSEYESPETFQTLSFGTSVGQMSAARFAENKR